MAQSLQASARNNTASLYDTDGSLFDATKVRYDYSSTIDETLWSKYFPFQLAVLELSSGVDVSTGQVSEFYSIHNGLVFTLPINPDTYTSSMPFAINVSATLGGVVEQHGGSPFRLINFGGTFGVVSDRPTAETLQAGKLNDVGGIFAGTLQAASNAATVATSLGAGQRFTSNLSSATPGNADGDILERSTGYYQFRMLQRFFEAYAEAKKSADGSKLRLALFVWKEEAAYLVTPLAFDVTKNAASPHEYRYSLRLQAWRHVNHL